MDNCPICSKLILAHSWQIECKICYSSYHMKCLSLCTDDYEHMRANTATWYCSSCIIQIFPLNTIEEDDILICELNGIDIDEYTIDSLSSRLFNPFQLNDKDYYTPLSQIDPDVNFFNNVNSHLGLSCNYYLENSFYDLVKSQMNNLTTENMFSLCHLNIRSLRANLSAFELTLHNLGIHFTAIGISETWLNDYNCDLYNHAVSANRILWVYAGFSWYHGILVVHLQDSVGAFGAKWLTKWLHHAKAPPRRGVLGWEWSNKDVYLVTTFVFCHVSKC